MIFEHHISRYQGQTLENLQRNSMAVDFLFKQHQILNLNLNGLLLKKEGRYPPKQVSLAPHNSRNIIKQHL